MAYGDWGKPKEERRAFSDKAYRRVGLADWDAKWHGLAAQARKAFLDDVKGPVRGQGGRPTVQPSVAVEKFPARVLEELVAAGFVVAKATRPKGPADKVLAVEGAYDFAIRARALRKYHLLAADPPGEFQRYVDYAYYNGEVFQVLARVLQSAGIDDLADVGEMVKRYVGHHRWPGWVVKFVKGPLAGRIVEAVRAAGGPVPIADLLHRLDAPAVEARPVLDKLVAHLALVEDLDPETNDLVVGLLPAVRAELERLDQPRELPPLLAVATPREAGPEDSVVVDDLRAFLLEVAGEPPRVRQDHAVFHKDTDRFLETFAALPIWLAEILGWPPEGRLKQALHWAHDLKLVKEQAEGKQVRLHLTPRGNSWLTGNLDDQHAELYRFLRGPAARDDLVFYDLDGLDIASPSLGFITGYGPGDTSFLGVSVMAVKAAKGKPRPYYWDVKPADYQPLREAVDRALAGLPLDVFHRLDSVVAHLAFGAASPLLLGLDPDQVAVYWGGRPVPPLEERREEAGRLMLDAFLRRRLIPLGGVRAAIDAEGMLCIARAPRLDAYFGRAVAPSAGAGAGAAPAESQVIVQPDFSVIVVGPNPAPAAELAPFCERTTRGGGQGALVLKLTRESVVKAVAHGLKPAEVVARLERLATKGVPANVLSDVRGWCGWVRRVQPATLTVLRCPDRDTADRVVAALRKQAERVGDTLVAIDRKKLGTAERNKLRDHGIVVGAEDVAEADRPGTRKPPRRY